MSKIQIAIIGGGPIGIAAGIEAQKRGLSYQIIEKGSLNNSIRNFPTGLTFFSTPEMLEIDDKPFTSVNVRPTRDEVLRYYEKVTLKHQLNLKLYTKVENVSGEDGNFSLDLSDGTTIESEKVILATGYFDHPNPVNVPGEDQHHVTHYYDEGFAYTGTDALVVGGMNSAVETSLDLFRHGANVTLVVREAELGDKVKPWIRPDIENRIKEGSIQAFFNTELKEINKKHTMVINHQTNEEWYQKSDFVFLMTGYRPDEALFRSMGIEMDEESLVPTLDAQFQTNRRGLYIAGSASAGCKPSLVFIENGVEHSRIIVEDIASKLS